MILKFSIQRIVIAFLSVVSTSAINAQQILPVDLETVLKLAGANNLTVKEYQLKYQQAIADQIKAKEWWLPDIYAGFTTHYLNGAAMNTDGKIYTDINRNNIWAGLGVAAEIDFSKGKYTLLAGKQKAAAINYQSLAERNKAILAAVEAYFDLQAEQLQYLFLRHLVGQSDTLSQQIKVQVDAGILYQSDYLLSQSNYNHLKISMLQAKGDWQMKSAMLASLLNMGSNISLISADTSLAPLELKKQIIDTTSLTSGFTKRPEYLGLNAELQSFETGRKTANEGLLLPKLRVGLDNGAFGAYAGPVQSTYQLNGALIWKLPFGRLSYKGDLKQWDAKIAIQNNKLEQFQNQYREEVTIATAQLQIADAQIAIAKEALRSSEESLDQSIERQKLGTAKPFEVFQAQQFYVQAQLDYFKSVAAYNKAQYGLKVALGEAL
ncbi:MAG TPA: TolC family protein [Puia sp.]